MDKSHKFEKLSLLLLFLLSLAILAGFLPIRIGALKGIVENTLLNAGADSVSIDDVSVTVFGGARVSGLKTYKRINARESYSVNVSFIDVSCNLFWLAVTTFFSPGALYSKEDIFREIYEKPLKLVGDVSARMMSMRRLKKIVLRNVDVKFSDNAGISINDASASVRFKIGRRAFEGNMFVKSVFIPSVAIIENFGAKLSANKESLDIKSGGGTVFGGKLDAELSLGLNESRVIGGRAHIKGLDLEKYCVETKFSPGRLGGKVDLKADIAPSLAAAIDSVKVKGVFFVSGLTATEVALQKTPAVNRLSKDLRQISFGEVAGDFLLDKGKIRFNEINGAGSVMKFKSKGWADFTGKIDQDFVGEFSPMFVTSLPKIVRNSLEPTSGGGGRFRCRITGTFHKPRVEIDKSVYDRAIGGFFKNMFK